MTVVDIIMILTSRPSLSFLKNQNLSNITETCTHVHVQPTDVAEKLKLHEDISKIAIKATYSIGAKDCYYVLLCVEIEVFFLSWFILCVYDECYIFYGCVLHLQNNGINESAMIKSI